MMPKDLYERLNRVFNAVRCAEEEALRLEYEAQGVRQRAHQEVQELYADLNKRFTAKETPA